MNTKQEDTSMVGDYAASDLVLDTRHCLESNPIEALVHAPPLPSQLSLEYLLYITRYCPKTKQKKVNNQCFEFYYF